MPRIKDILIPLIVVRDKIDGKCHVVGDNHHDSLIIDNEEGTLRYYNLQNGQYSCKDRYGYEFVGGDPGYYGRVCVQYVSADKYLKRQYRIMKTREEFEKKMFAEEGGIVMD
jgi:hypothetical protein